MTVDFIREFVCWNFGSIYSDCEIKLNLVVVSFGFGWYWGSGHNWDGLGALDTSEE